MPDGRICYLKDKDSTTEDRWQCTGNDTDISNFKVKPNRFFIHGLLTRVCLGEH